MPTPTPTLPSSVCGQNPLDPSCFSPEPITPELPSNESFEPIAFFIEDIALPFFGFMGTYEDAINFGKPINKQARFLLPFGLIEASGNAILQGYHDRWYQSLNPAQRTGRMVIVGVETYIPDKASTLAGATGALLGPAGYGAAAYTVSAAGDRFWTNEVNPWLFNSFGLVVYP